MSNHPIRFSVFRRLWKPVVVTSAGGTAVAIWYEEILMFGQEILMLISLPIMAAVLYLLDIFMFRSRMPHREDLEKPSDKGTKR